VTVQSQPRIWLDTQSISLNLTSISPVNPYILLRNVGISDLHWSVNSICDGNGSWLRVAPASGTLFPAFMIWLTVPVHPSGLTSGTYHGSLTFSSDDPTQPVVVVPVTLQLTAIPHISVGSLSFDTVYVGHTRSRDLLLHNTGLAPLTVDSIGVAG